LRGAATGLSTGLSNSLANSLARRGRVWVKPDELANYALSNAAKKVLARGG
jgi:hypothetical protein